MSAQELYKAVLFEERKHNMRSVTPDEFNHHSMVGMQEYVKMVYWADDVHQKSIDDLSSLVVVTDGLNGNPPYIPNTGQAIAGREKFACPVDYMYMLSVAFLVTYKNEPCHADGTVSQKPIGAKILERNATNMVQRNTLLRPAAREGRLYAQTQGLAYTVKAGDSLCTAMCLEYLKVPQPAVVDPATGATVTNPDLGQTQHVELVRWIAASILENIESLRQQTMQALEAQTFRQYPMPNQPAQ